MNLTKSKKEEELMTSLKNLTFGNDFHAKQIIHISVATLVLLLTVTFSTLNMFVHSLTVVIVLLLKRL